MRIKHLTTPLALAIAMLCTVAVPVAAAETADEHYIVMLGAPGAGKSTNSEKLAAKHGIPWVEVGEIVEDAVAKTDAQDKSVSKRQRGPSKIRRSYHSQRSQKTESALKKLQAGELVDDDSLNILVAAELLSSTASKGFILDGYPMTVQQAAFLDSLLAAKNHGPLDVIYLNVPDDVASILIPPAPVSGKLIVKLPGVEAS